MSTLSEIVTSWTPADIANKNLLLPALIDHGLIPQTFVDIASYRSAFYLPLLDEVRAKLDRELQEVYRVEQGKFSDRVLPADIRVPVLVRQGLMSVRRTEEGAPLKKLGHNEVLILYLEGQSIWDGVVIWIDQFGSVNTSMYHFIANENTLALECSAYIARLSSITNMVRIFNAVCDLRQPGNAVAEILLDPSATIDQPELFILETEDNIRFKLFCAKMQGFYQSERPLNLSQISAVYKTMQEPAIQLIHGTHKSNSFLF
jgi:hypothetical protein